MGIDFRSGGYVRHVFWGGRTIKDGEAAAIWNYRGVHRQIVGPRRVFMYNSTIRFLTRYKAEAHQYLCISHRNGRVEHQYGPAILYQDPVLHDSIVVINGICLHSENECIVVYNSSSSRTEQSMEPMEEKAAIKAMKASDTESENSERAPEKGKRVIRGPTLFLPALGETVHEFRWSGKGDNGEFAREKNVFSVLHTDPNRVYSLSVPITTADSVEFTASISFQYHMDSLDKCLDSMDPIQNMYDGLLADARSFGDTVTSDQLKAGKQLAVVERLASLKTYTFLCQAAEAAGFTVDSVRVTGLSYCHELQRQADCEQQLAARLRSELAEKKQRREILDLEVEERRLRIEQEAELGRKQAEVTAKLEKEAHALKEAALERKLALKKREVEANNALLEKEDAAVIQFLKALKNEGVDMTTFMCTAGGMKIASSVLSRAATLQKNQCVDESLIKESSNRKSKSEKDSIHIAWSS